MFRHPQYLEVPWHMHWHRVTMGPHRHLWWLIGSAHAACHISDRPESHTGDSMRGQNQRPGSTETDA